MTTNTLAVRLAQRPTTIITVSMSALAEVAVPVRFGKLLFGSR